MSIIWKGALPVAIAIGILSGCGTQTPISGTGTTSIGGSAEDQAEVSQQLAQNIDLVDEPVFSADVECEVGADLGMSGPGGRPGPGGRRDSTRRPPLRFWRRITHVDRTFEITYRDTDSTGHPTFADVAVNKRLTGVFVVAMPESGQRPRVVQKPLADHWQRRLVLERVRISDADRPQWRIVGTSGVQITSRAAVTRIASIHLEASAWDTTITDPLAIFRLRRVLHFDAGDSIKITVTTQRNDDVVVLQLRDRHVPFKNNGDATYSFTLRTGMLRGVNHLGVNALSHGTLFDAGAAYDSQAWIVPFVVRPTELADWGRP